MPHEVWKPVTGFEDLYEVSNLGAVRRSGRAARTGKGRGGGAVIGRIMAQQITPSGYLQTTLSKDGKAITKLVHVLVAETFIGPRPEGYEVNHDDGNKLNCSETNLEWMTRSENMVHAYGTGLRERKATVSGETHHKCKLTDVQVVEIRRRFIPRVCGGPELAREFGVSHNTIYSIVKMKIRKVLA